MTLKDIRLSFIQVETLTPALAALAPPTIPYKFLLSDALFQEQIAKSQSGVGPLRLPWHDTTGKRFWFYYLERKGAAYVKPKDAWRGLVPLQSASDGTASAAWISGTITTHGYLHPWGISAIVDVCANGSWTLDEALQLALNVRREKKFDWKLNGEAKQLALGPLMDNVIRELRIKAYGPNSNAGQTGDVFSVVTIMDAEGAAPTAEIPPKEDLHRAFECLTDWSPNWKIVQLKDLKDSETDIMRKVSPAGHFLYGGRRGRTVWFPAGFKSNSPPHPEGLKCYHQNLLASTLQTESLCRFAQSVAKQLSGGQTIGDFSVTYGNCAKLAAGLLGRLYGGSNDTYRSASLRDQIKRSYVDPVNVLRGATGMPLLS